MCSSCSLLPPARLGAPWVGGAATVPAAPPSAAGDPARGWRGGFSLRTAPCWLTQTAADCTCCPPSAAGDPARGWSDEFSFQTAPLAGPEALPYRLGLVGDLGQTDHSLRWVGWRCLASSVGLLVGD